MLRRPPRSTLSSSSAASDVYKRQVLEVPAQHDLPGRHAVLVGDVAQELVVEVGPLERAVPRDRDAAFGVGGEQGGVEVHRAPWYLVDRGCHSGRLDQLVDLRGGVVADAVSYTHLRAHETPEH